MPSPVARIVAVLSRRTCRLGNVVSKLLETNNRTRVRMPKTRAGIGHHFLRAGVFPDSRLDEATRSHGNANKSSVQASLSQGNKKNPESSGPKMQPNTLTAYALAARSGSPPDHLSTSFGVR